MEMERKRYIRRLMSLGQCSSFIRWTVEGFAVFFAALPWIMLGLLCMTGFAGEPNGTGIIFLFGYLAVVSLFYHYTRALSTHWSGYPFYPEDRTLLARYHHAFALIAVSVVVIVPWSWTTAMAVVVGLLCLDLMFDSGAMCFGEHTVRSTRVSFDVAVSSLTEVALPSGQMSHTIGLPEIFRGEADILNESAHDAESDLSTTQCQKRKLQINGIESVEGMVRVSFKEGEEQTVIHLAFCPSLSTVPEIQTEIISDLDTHVEANVTLSQMYGARIELKRTARTLDELPVQTVSLYYYASVPAVCERIAQ